MIEVRRASVADDAALARVDAAAYTTTASPAPARPAHMGFFEERRPPDDVLVAELDGVAVGYAHLGQTIPVPSHQHVLQLMGLAVDPRWQRRGVGRRLVEEAIEEARRRGARKLSVRVLSANSPARRLYEALGFEVEGTLREEFLIAGEYIDDVLMARRP